MIVAIAVAVVASPASLAKPKRTKRVVVTTTMTAVAKPALEVKGIRDSTPFALLASSTSGVSVATVLDDHSSPWIAPQSVAWQEEWRSTTQRLLVVTELVEFPSLVREKPDIPVEKLNDFTRPGDSISTALTIRNHVLLWLYVSPGIAVRR